MKKQLVMDLPCPAADKHTPTGLLKSDYLGWHEWAKKMDKTHEQTKCVACGRWEVWIQKRRPVPNIDADEPVSDVPF